MLSIGEFARLAGLSVRTLRHYDAIGLLSPASVDAGTGYRRYDASQFARLNRALALKDLGFTLEQVRSIVAEQVTAEELRGMLRLRQVELVERIDADRERLARVERRLRMIEREGAMSENEYTTKSLEGLRLAAVVRHVDSIDEVGAVMGPAFDTLMAEVTGAGARPVGPPVGFYDTADDGGVLAGAGVAVAVAEDRDLAGAEAVEMVDLRPVPQAVTTMHQGAMATIGETWQALVRHLEENGWRAAGVCREVYLHTDMSDEGTWLTELQQPVERT